MLILGAIRSALQAADDIEVVGVTHSGAEVMGLVERERPDVVLLDNRMPGVDGLTCLKQIKKRYPAIKVLMLSASEEPKVISEALAAGASAYIGTRINPQDLASAVRQVVAGVVYYQAALPADLEQPAKTNGSAEALTSRERTMLEAISRGMSTKAISNDLWISEKTVKFHLTNIYRKLGVHNRTGAMRYAYEHDLIPSPPQDEQAPLSDIG
jgi:DNA-binding NarL/FixJ family response regulator